jgi:hypothetical protein
MYFFTLLLIGRCCFYCVILLGFLLSSFVPANMLFIIIKLHVLLSPLVIKVVVYEKMYVILPRALN